jgi:KEOPS complex subunit Pcc1
VTDMHKAVFSFELGEDKNIAVLAALKPEASRELPRAMARVWTEGKTLNLEIKAEDAISLRAAVNSYLRWVKVAADAAAAGTTPAGETRAGTMLRLEGGKGKKTTVGFKVEAEGKKSKKGK